MAEEAANTSYSDTAGSLVIMGAIRKHLRGPIARARTHTHTDSHKSVIAPLQLVDDSCRSLNAFPLQPSSTLKMIRVGKREKQQQKNHIENEGKEEDWVQC